MEGAWVPESPLGGECLADQNTCLGFYIDEKQIFIVFKTLGFFCFFVFLAALRGLQDLSSPSRN